MRTDYYAAQRQYVFDQMRTAIDKNNEAAKEAIQRVEELRDSGMLTYNECEKSIKQYMRERKQSEKQIENTGKKLCEKLAKMNLAARISVVCCDGYDDKEDFKQAIQILANEMVKLKTNSAILGALESMCEMLEDMEDKRK